MNTHEKIPPSITFNPISILIHTAYAPTEMNCLPRCIRLVETLCGMAKNRKLDNECFLTENKEHK
jgi:hypothetical protein